MSHNFGFFFSYVYITTWYAQIVEIGTWQLFFVWGKELLWNSQLYATASAMKQANREPQSQSQSQSQSLSRSLQQVLWNSQVYVTAKKKFFFNSFYKCIDCFRKCKYRFQLVEIFFPKYFRKPLNTFQKIHVHF